MASFVLLFGELVLVVVVALAALVIKTIDLRGFFASVLVGWAIILGGGIQWFVVVGVFFILGVSFTLYEYGYKKRLGGAQEKGGARGWPNILANGGLPSLFAVSQFFYPGTAFAALFLGSVSTAAADTAATEIGLLSKVKPRLITNLRKKVSPGTSGGVSSLGFVGAALASGVIGVMALLLGMIGVSLQPLEATGFVLLLCALGGLAGTVADSLLGALVQRKGYCTVCMKSTEALTHCGEKARSTSGAPFVENNVVNLVATFVGGVSSLGVLFLFGLG